MKSKKILIFFLFFFFFNTALKAEEKNIPSQLDFNTRDNKIRFLEIEPFVGEYLGNYLNNSYVLGARLGFRLTGAITVGAEFNYSSMQFDDDSQFGKSVTDRKEMITQGYFTYAFPILQRTGKAIQEADLTTTVGAGLIHLNGKNRFEGCVGGGLKIYTSKPWLALRFDVMTYMYSIPRLNDSRFADDWTFSAGPSFLFF
ncbi:MAG: hypothetical protein HQM15_11005 [Deltaproteobacteria bacterium]|nr:hypothetical protein [Deltaproteobacteria bacterium]